MLKLCTSVDWDWGERSSKLMPVGSTGLDISYLNKYASSGDHREWLRKVAAVDGHDLLHIIAVADSEHYGYNRNADGFSGADNCKSHDGFTKHAYVFRNHKHDVRKGHPTFGQPVASFYHPEMKRIELVNAVNRKTAGDIIQAAANGDDVAWSMGCVTDPNYPVLTMRGYKPISEVVVGDQVYTHAGNWRPVVQLNRRRWSGTLYKFHIGGLPLPLELTSDHPMWAKLFSLTTAGVTRHCIKKFFDGKDDDTQPPGWVHAAHVEVGDRFFYRPVVYDRSKVTALDSVGLAALLGFYLAEGSVSYCKGNPNTVRLACNIDDDLPQVLPELVSRLRPGTECSMYPHASSPVGLSVEVHAAELARFVSKYVGTGAKSKRIPPEIFVAAEDVRAAFLGAWLSGDGFLDDKGVHWSSANIGLVLQGRDLLATLGVPSSIYKITHPAGAGFSSSDTVEYTLNIPHRFAEVLLPYACRKLDGLASYLLDDQSNRPSTMRKTSDGLFAYRVKKVEIRTVADVPTYNFEVADDNSYSLAGLISHNCDVPFDVCTVCGNKAAKPAEYCEHAKRPNLGRLLKTGEICGLDNPNAKWFDISNVFRPAERIAYTVRMVKTAASNGVIHLPVNQEGVCGGAELAKVAGITLPSFMKQTDAGLEKWAALQALAAMEKMVPSGAEAMAVVPEELSDEAEEAVRKRAMDDGHLNNVFEDLHGRGILLHPEQLFKIAFGLDNYEETVAPLMPEVRSSLPGMFTRALDRGADDLVKEARFDGCGELKQKPMSGAYEQCTFGCDATASIDSDRVEKRVLASAIVGTPRRRKVIIPKTASVHPAVEGLADLYAAYGLSFAAHPHNGESLLAKRAVVQTTHGEYSNE